MSKKCILYRQLSELPDVSPVAQATFGAGYLNDMRCPADFLGKGIEEADLVIVAGGRTRYNGLNQQIVESYAAAGVPGFYAEFGRLVPDSLLMLLGTKPWLPPVECPPDRLERLGIVYTPTPRGEHILVCGQRPELDNELLPAIETIKNLTGRKVVFRPHPNAWRLLAGPEYNFLHLVDEISERITDEPQLGERVHRDLHQDLDNAWCVVSHSSLAALQGLLRGIPCITGSEFVLADAVCPLERANEVNNLVAPSFEELQPYLCRHSYTIWFNEELRNGEAFTFLKRFV